MTDGSILAGLTGTLVNIKPTVDAVKPRQTLTDVHANQVVTGGSVATGAGLTLVYLIFTVDSWWRRGKLVGYWRKRSERNMRAMMMMLAVISGKCTCCLLYS